MRDRWQPVVILAGVLFAINAVVRLIVWQVGPKSDSKQITVGFVGLALVGLVMAGAGWRWGRRYPMSRVTPDLCVAVAVACLLTVLVGPFFGGTRPFKEGAGLFFAEIWHYLAFAGPARADGAGQGLPGGGAQAVREDAGGEAAEGGPALVRVT